MMNTLTTIIIENKNIKTKLQCILKQHGRYEYNVTKNIITVAYFFFFKQNAKKSIQTQLFKDFIERIIQLPRDQKLGQQLLENCKQQKNIKYLGFPIETILQKATIQLQP